MDIYRSIGMMTEPEYQHTRMMAEKYRGDTRVAKASQIVAEDFATNTNLGILRLREHELFQPNFEIEELCRLLSELFPPTT